jgi:hypothetical protein
MQGEELDGPEWHNQFQKKDKCGCGHFATFITQMQWIKVCTLLESVAKCVEYMYYKHVNPTASS